MSQIKVAYNVSDRMAWNISDKSGLLDKHNK